MKQCPLEYLLCARTVTIYRKQGQTILRKVFDNCFFSWQEQQTVDKLGRRTEKQFLLVMPGYPQQVFPGDRVYDGVGPEVSAEQWPSFVPALVPELAEASYAEPCYWNGEICHVEAGRK